MDDDTLDSLLGPQSPTRIMLGDLSTVYAAFPAFLFPVISEKGGKGVDDHDRIGQVAARESVRLEDVVGRARDTIDLVLGVVFADDERRDVAAAIRELHRFIHGHLDDGKTYHAWENDLWNWTWAAIVIPLMETHGRVRGWPSDAFREDAYAGLRAVGELFGANALPHRYADLLNYRDSAWMDVVDPHAAQATRYLLGQIEQPASLRRLGRVPAVVMRLASWPVRHIARMGLLIVSTPTLNSAIGIDVTRADRAMVAMHLLLWRLIPRRASRGWIARYMYLRIRFGSPVWHTHYSPAALADYRLQMRRARAADSEEPTRPSATNVGPR